jgi:hypothetical protein
MTDGKFPRHFDGKRFYNPDAPQARGFLDLVRWKLTSRPESSPDFIPDVDEPIPLPHVEGRAHKILGAKTSIAIHHGTFQLADDGIDAPQKQLMARRGDDSLLILKNGQFARIP